MTKPEDIEFRVNDQTICALHWRCSDERARETPLICLHGWLDNAASFSAIAPLLLNRDIFALDLAGHGHSSHRCAHGSYNIWEDIEDILAIADKLGYEKFDLLAHSRGGFVSMLLASSMPERVQEQILLDSFLPAATEQTFPTQLRKYLLDRQKYDDRQLGAYDTIDAAITQRIKTTRLSADEAKNMVERDLVKIEDAYCWRHDIRMHAASAVRLTQSHVDEILDSLSVPTTLLLAEQSEYDSFFLNEARDRAIQKHSSINLCRHPGAHHFHMEAEHTKSVANMINDLWSTG